APQDEQEDGAPPTFGRARKTKGQPMNSLWRRLFGSGSAKARSSPRPRFCRPRVEALEDRWCPSCTITTDFTGHALSITGDGATNEVTIIENPITNDLELTCDGSTTHFAADFITRIDAYLKEGNDKFTYQMAELG